MIVIYPTLGGYIAGNIDWKKILEEDDLTREIRVKPGHKPRKAA